jgi:hypothetical protein
MRRVLIALATLIAASSAGVTSGHAQSKGPKPWCIESGAFGPGTMDCTYWTLQQCRESASGAGGMCVENPVILWQRWEQGKRQRTGQPFNRGGY